MTLESKFSIDPANGSNASPDADPDNGGLANLLEFALGSTPSGPSSAAKPSAELQGTHLEISFTKAQTSALTSSAEVSSDLQIWTTDVTDVTPGGSPGGFTVLRTNVASTSSPPLFIRLGLKMP